MLKNSSELLSKPLQVGNVTLRNRTLLAPMSGVTDVPFRRLAWEYGAGLVVSEMVASQALVEGEGEMYLKMLAGEVPLHVVQIAGREAHWMALAAKMAQDNGAQIVDINMGCPAKRVTTGYSGSALMRNLDHANELIDAVVSAVNVPVTLKMRLGWDHETINAPELAKRAENSGIKMITVHGRTRCQFYKGEADWNRVHAVREEINVPLVVNGDIIGRESAAVALEQSQADAVMVGRGSYGAPWMPGQIAGGSAICPASLCSLVKQHHEEMLLFYGEQSGIRQARKHLGWYLDQLKSNEEIGSCKKSIMTSFDPSEIYRLLDRIFAMQDDPISPVQAAA